MPPITTTDTFVVGKTKEKLIYATPEWQARIVNGGGGKLFYKTASGVTTSDTEVAKGSAFTTDRTVFVISDSRANVSVEHREVLADTGFSEPPGVWSWQPVAATTGTDTAFAEKKLFLASLFLPTAKTVTGIGILLGGEGGTTRLVAGLFDRNGRLLAKSTETSEGTVAGTKETIQELAFTAPSRVTAGTYFIGVTGNGTTAKVRMIPAQTAGKNVFAGEVELATKNVLANVTVPSTFTAAKGPVGFIY